MAKRMHEHQLAGAAEPMSPLADLRRRNLDLLKTLIGKTIEIRSNAYQGTVRTYEVKDVREVTIDVGTGFTPGVKLINRGVKDDAQPTLKYPTELIDEIDDGETVSLELSYSYEPNIQRSFRHLYKKSKPDMVITLTYHK